MSFTQNIKKYFLPALLLVALLISVLKPSTDDLRLLAPKIQSKLNETELLFEQAAKNGSLTDIATHRDAQNPTLVSLQKQHIDLYWYKKDSLIYWSGNSVSLLSSPNSLDRGTSFIKLKNGWYQAMKYLDSSDNQVMVGLTVVKYQYPFENKFLKNDFALGLTVPDNIEINEQKIAGSVQIKDAKGKPLFSIYQSADEKGDYVNYILLLAQVLLLILVFYYLHQFAVNKVKNKGFITGFLYLIACILIVRGLMLWLDQPSEFYKLDLFNPKYYASSLITKSLGDLVINCLLLIWIVLFAAYYKGATGFKWRNTWLSGGLFIASVFLFTAAITWVFKTLVMDSVISFEVYNILSLSLYSLIGIICLALLLVSHFLFTRQVIVVLLENNVRPLIVVILSLSFGILYSLFSYDSPFYESVIFSATWTSLSLIVFYVAISKNNSLSIRNLILYIAVYSVFSAYLIENLYERKERNNRLFFAGKLITERDFVAEYMFEDVAQRIAADPFLKNYFDNPLIPKKEIVDRLVSVYLSGYFNRYEVKVYTYDKHGNSMRGRDTVSLSNFTRLIKEDTIRPHTLHYIGDTVQNYYYLSFFPFGEDTAFAGTLILRLIPKVYYGQNVYPELLLGGNISSGADNNYSSYDYAIYQHDRLIIQHGDFPYPYYWERAFKFDNQQYRYIDIGDWEHIIYNFANDKKVIVTIGQEGLFEPIATFSYLFSFYFIISLALLLLYRSMKSRAADSGALGWFILSFRTRINYSMLLMIIISFVIIGIITISFFRKQYDNFYNDRLLRKEKAVHASLEYFIQQTGGGDAALSDERLNTGLELEVSRLAEINDIDINLYDTEGDLAVASQPAIYDKGIISKKMNSNAYFGLVSTKGAQITEQEKIGTLKYLATYAPLRNSKGEAIAYLGIPYFARSKNINDEVSSFLVALMNVYVFLLICAAIVAYFISNSITRPLTIISEKLRILNLNKKNEPIEWKSNDEIGTLIGEYNKMISELEQSALKLAKSERESAWREMAKQIAHEIKNPLTPMKLSIQYLQRAIDSGSPDIEILAKKVATTLEEQIENLSSIATAFSSFAKMPKAQNEIINLNELLKSITDLFNREGKATITFTTDCDAPYIFADKNQMVSVFNNLVKNAIQSIPEGRAGFIDIHIKEQEDRIVTSVSDNGTGIEKQLYDKVFVPNFTTKSSGTGLGLAITRQIVDGAGGTIWFESAGNVGTTFFVMLKKSDGV